MTEKELRKLSRLELLELLLDASRENEKLKEKIKQMELENRTAHNIEALYDTTCLLETTLASANKLTENLKNKEQADIPVIRNTREVIPDKRLPVSMRRKPVSDKDLYCRMLHFFTISRDALQIFPADLARDVTTRVEDLLAKTNKK